MKYDPRDYKFGDKGAHIEQLQKRLVEAGYSLPQYGIDGFFGDETREAIEQFETDISMSDTRSFTVDRRTLCLLLEEEEVKPEPPILDISLPRGKGMFIRSWSHVGSPEKFRTYILDNGIKWVSVLRLWQYEDPESDKYYNQSKWEQYVPILVDSGCDLWIWGWPHPNRHKDFVSELDERAQEWGAVGIMVDVEKPWKNEEEAAILLVNELEATSHTVGFTSYGAPWNHSSLPFEVFSRLDFGIPQIYDMDNNMPEDYPSKSVQAWQDLGFKNIIPASAAFGKTKKQMESLLSRTPTPNGGLVWWDWYNANLKNERWEVVREYSL